MTNVKDNQPAPFMPRPLMPQPVVSKHLYRRLIGDKADGFSERT